MEACETTLERGWVYQRERFPVFAHGPLIFAFSLSALCFSSLLRGAEVLPAWQVVAVAFLSSFFSFLHLRLADEFKDFDEDSRYRPYRPVPRGLVSLRELGVLWVITGILQLGLAASLSIRLIPLLLVTWVYLGLMSKEFFCRDWLKAHPFTYMWTHMFIMPLIDFYATACDWEGSSGYPPSGLFWFVLVSFFNGFIIEIGRKIRAPGDEETGVETYSALWGRKRAVQAWLFVMGVTWALAAFASARIGFFGPVTLLLGGLFFSAVFLGVRFLRAPTNGKPFEVLSGIWTMCIYLILGIIPLAWKLWL